MSKLLNLLWLSFLLPLALLAQEARVVNLTVTPRTPWNGKMDISYSLECDNPSAFIRLSFQAHDTDRDEAVTMTTLSGDGAEGMLVVGGPYTTTWDSAQDYPNGHSSKLAIEVSTETIGGASYNTNYLVIDLTSGFVWDSETAPDLDDDACRTTQLWLRKVPAGSFYMGSPEQEVGRGSNETSHQVTLSSEYYIGVFEMTQKQYQLIAGSNPSQYKGDTRPVEKVTYIDIRGTTATLGAGWPTYSYAVDEDSFIGKLRAKTNLLFDLPTEAQWEYACRAGTITALNSNKNLTNQTTKDDAMDEVGRYNNDRDDANGGYSQHTKVGSYLPNAWGLYDMHGNVAEWCLDWFGSYPEDSVLNPVGPTSGNLRAFRGGYYTTTAKNCRSAYRGSVASSTVNNYMGFRVVMLPIRTVTFNGETVQVLPGTVVTRTAPATDQSGRPFSKWIAEGMTLDEEDAQSQTLTFVMPFSNVTLTPKYEMPDGNYLVIDLTNGSYRFTNDTPNLSSDTCRTTQLWLKKITAGSFDMGSPTSELGRGNDEAKHRVTLSQNYFIGIFEMTQKQYQLIAGSNPSQYKGDTRPVENVSFNDIRGATANLGAGWPTYNNAVDSNSFLGKLRTMTGGLVFDLPTEAQWEFACRAGTTTALNTNANLTSTRQDGAMDAAGRYIYNKASGTGGYKEHTKVGSYPANAWGLYDMHGNVAEWCLDWYEVISSTNSTSDPKGSALGAYRLIRGGNWSSIDAQFCRSASRSYLYPGNTENFAGFRVVMLP